MNRFQIVGFCSLLLTCVHHTSLYYVNINGVKLKLPSLLGLIDKNKYDVVLLTETKVYSKSSIKIPGYQLYPVMRGSGQGGGLLCAVKHGLCSSTRGIMPSFSLSSYYFQIMVPGLF